MISALAHLCLVLRQEILDVDLGIRVSRKRAVELGESSVGLELLQFLLVEEVYALFSAAKVENRLSDRLPITTVLVALLPRCKRQN